jgi:hypothetical protein
VLLRDNFALIKMVVLVMTHIFDDLDDGQEYIFQYDARIEGLLFETIYV